MADDKIKILALLADVMRAADRDREETMCRFERFAEVFVEKVNRLGNNLGSGSDNTLKNKPIS